MYYLGGSRRDSNGVTVRTWHSASTWMRAGSRSRSRPEPIIIIRIRIFVVVVVVVVVVGIKQAERKVERGSE